MMCQFYMISFRLSPELNAKGYPLTLHINEVKYEGDELQAMAHHYLALVANAIPSGDV